MKECKVCGDMYHQNREHCPACGTFESRIISPGELFNASVSLRVGIAHGAMRAKQNLYEGKILGLKIR